jgi:hypothetical protein
MISDSDIQKILNRIQFDVKINHPTTCLSQPTMFQRNESIQNRSKFNLENLMEEIETTGYSSCSEKLDGLKSKLYSHQTQAVQWMVDQENNRGELGLNSLFWGYFDWLDGGRAFYFPMAGELRLTKPPKVTGGILAEEMGLGMQSCFILWLIFYLF